MAKKKHTNRKKQHRVPFFRRPWVIFLLLILIAGVVIYILYAMRPQAEETPASTPNQPTTVSNPVVESPTADPEEETAGQAEPDDKAVQYEGEDTNKLPELTGSITRKSVANGKLTIVAVVDQYLRDNGTCAIKLQDKHGKVLYTNTVAAVADVTASVCEPFEIPVQGLAGNYDIVITLSGDNKYGEVKEEVNL